MVSYSILKPIHSGDSGWAIPLARIATAASVVEPGTDHSRGRSFGSGGCALGVYVDGVPIFDSHLDWIQPEGLEAVEVYRGLDTPIEYRFFNPCGVVLLWT